jgi:hypothetical protein
VSIFLAWFKNHWLQVTLKGAKAERLDWMGIVNLSPLVTLESNILSPSTLVLKFSKHAATCFRIEVAENCFRIG